MNYELANQLKDAGFKFSEPFALDPTLEELIEACGDGDFKLTRTQLWHACIVQGEHTEHSWQHAPTPTEAVAKLWLALNKK